MKIGGRFGARLPYQRKLGGGMGSRITIYGVWIADVDCIKEVPILPGALIEVTETSIASSSVRTALPR